MKRHPKSHPSQRYSVPSKMLLRATSTAWLLSASAHVAVTPFRDAQCVARPTLPRARPVLLRDEATETPSTTAPVPFFQPNVPDDQQAIQELRVLRQQAFMNWPADEAYTSRLRGLYQNIMLFASLPIAYVTFDQLPQELPQLFIAANIGTFAVMIPFIARLRVTWGLTGQRLRAKDSYYEANQRGLFANKDRGTQLRDRLAERDEVQPALRRMDVSLAATVAALFLSLTGGEALTLALGEAGPATLKTLSGNEAIGYTNRLRFDENFARREQQRALRKQQEDGSGVRPVYCDSRYYRILAGGNSQGGVGCSD